jgi:hypothetical protein
MIAQLTENNAYYQRIINEKMRKQVALERSMMRTIKDSGVDWKASEKKQMGSTTIVNQVP